MVLGSASLWTDRVPLSEVTIAYGGSLAVLSTLICLVFFLPAAHDDAVLRRDGSFNWIYVDTQYNYSIAANIKNGDSPPKEPGTATQELLYHFGAYVPAAAISRLDGLDLGDAFVRVTRGTSLWALVLSCFGVGTLLSLKATGTKFGGIASVAGLFFYGSLLSLFSDERNSSSYVTGAILYKIPGVEILSDGGPFDHLILGHSMLHGLIAITAIMGMCLVQLEREAALTWRGTVLLALPALAVPMHSVAALYCIGVAGILLFWERLRSARSWIAIVIMFALFLAAWKIMGYSHAPDAVQATVKKHLIWQWSSLGVGFIVGLGFRIVGFRWISRPTKDPLSALVLATLLGLLFFSLLFQLDGNERYGIYFLQCMFSIFAFSRLRPGFWRGAERSLWITEWFKLARNGMTALAVVGVMIAIVFYVRHQHTGIESFYSKIALFSLSACIFAGISVMMKRNRRISTFCSALFAIVLMLGFSAWITPWLNFGLGRMKMDVTITPGEFQGLNRLHDLAVPGERFATNKHVVESLAANRERSYSYDALSGHPVLLEGYRYRGESAVPGFESLLHDNDLMFTTDDPETLRNLVQAYQVHWLVARPGTDISLPRPLPAWVVQQQQTGDIKIYQIK
jgi:hypothetical protein